jgi:hypothetical protein
MQAPPCCCCGVCDKFACAKTSPLPTINWTNSRNRDRRNKTEGENAEAGQDEEADALLSATQVNRFYECGFQASSAQT